MAYNTLQKLKNNIQAIRVALNWDGRAPIAEDDRRLLESYSGFGGIKAVLFGAGDLESWQRQGASGADIRLYEPVQELYSLLERNFDKEAYQTTAQSLRNSILTAFYTPPIVAETLYSVLKNQGIEPVNIYEPSAGAGIFVSEAASAFPSANITAVEKDLLTGKILQALVSGIQNPVTVHVTGFEQVPVIDDDTYDLVVGNIPFGNFSVHDGAFSNKGISGRIHNYFFAKGLDKLADGGILAYITTSGFLDSRANLAARQYLFSRANFISLVVMPDNLMHQTGGTDAPSHLLIVQKNRNKTGLTHEEELLLQTVERTNSVGAYNVNRYVHLHPWIVNGNKITEGKNQYGKAHLQVIQEGEVTGIAAKLSGLLTQGFSERFKQDLFPKPVIDTSPIPSGHSKRFTYLPMPEISGEKAGVQLGLFSTIQVSNQGRGMDYLLGKDLEEIKRQSVRVIGMLKTTQRPDHECIIVLAGRSQKKDFYLYKIFSNVAEISPASDWVKASILSFKLKELAKKLSAFNQTYLFEGDKYLQTALLPETRGLAEVIELPTPFYAEGMLAVHNGTIVRLGLVDKLRSTAQFEGLPSQKNIVFYQCYIAVRDAFLELSQTGMSSGQPQGEYRQVLNDEYDRFRRMFGPLNDPANRKLVLADAHGLVMLSSVERNENGQYVKADIVENTLELNERDFKTDDPVQALARCLNETGKVDLTYISSALGMDEPDAVASLGNRIYLDPQTGDWQTSDAYLSGNVVEKLEMARLKAAEYPENSQFQRSLDALLTVQPERVPFELLDFNLGERWIPVRHYEKFSSELFDHTDIKVSYFSSLDIFRVSPVHNMKTDREFAVSPKSGKTMYGYTLLEHALENTAPVFTYETRDADGSVVRVPDNEATQLAHQKIEQIRSAFTDWLSLLPSPEKKALEDLYNNTFNCYVLRGYDGSHLDFPGLDRKALGIKDLYPSQKSAAWRIIQDRGALVDHEVGLGKTLTMIVSAQEMKRLGIVKKPMILALKANVGQIAETYRKAYPKARILFPSEKDFTPARRLGLFHQIKNNNYDCVILTHDQFGKIPQAPSIQRQIIQAELKCLEQDLETLSKLGGELFKVMLKGLEIRKNNLNGRLLAIQQNIEEKKDTGIDFEGMGIDHLFVDEAHKFKNLGFTTRHNRVAGLGNTEGSQKALNMLFAVRSLQERFNKDLCVTFLSGTPISNSLTELYLLFKYLRPRELRRQGIENFDGWASVFARKTTDFEFSVTNQIIAKERFRHFIKVPELALFYNEITDYKTAKHISLDKPGLEETLVNIKPTPDQQRFIRKLMEFAVTGDGELIGRGPLSREEDKGRMLVATNYAKKMSLDMRLIDEFEYGDAPDSKINVCARKFAEVYAASSPHLGTQLVFCDQGTPGTKGFNVYEALKEKLVTDFGIPAHEIGFVHDWQGSKKNRTV